MGKLDLIKAISDKTSYTVKEVGTFLDAFIDIVQGTVAKGDEVNVTGFGKFERKLHPARQCSNPHTGEAVSVPECYAPHFKVGATFKSVVKEGGR